MLRWGSSIHNFRRTATSDTEIARRADQGGRQGRHLLRVRQPRRGRCSTTRTASTSAARRTTTSTFGGGGVHFCLGASLARAEIKATMRQFVAPATRPRAGRRAAPPALRLRQRHQDDAVSLNAENLAPPSPSRRSPFSRPIDRRLPCTPTCDELGIEFPIFAFTHCRDVVAAVSKAGGFGVLGAVGFTPEQLEIELDWIDEHVGDKPYGVDIVIPGKYEGMGELDPDEARGRSAGHGPARSTVTSSSKILADHGVPTLPDGGGHVRAARLDGGHRHARRSRSRCSTRR